MRNTDPISDLYYGNIRPNEISLGKIPGLDRTLDSFDQAEKWLTEHLDGKAKKKLLDLLNGHSEISAEMAYESFREGFRLGVMLLVEIYNDSREF